MRRKKRSPTKEVARALMSRICVSLSVAPHPALVEDIRGRTADVFFLGNSEMRDLKRKSGLRSRASPGVARKKPVDGSTQLTINPELAERVDGSTQLTINPELAERVDVLAFPEPRDFPALPGTRKSLGEIYLNWDMNRDNPKRLISLFIHGLLHLVGYDHKKNRDSIEMETMEKRLWRHVCFWA